jgi:hypothetical protein
VLPGRFALQEDPDVGEVPALKDGKEEVGDVKAGADGHDSVDNTFLPSCYHYPQEEDTKRDFES